MAQGSKGRRAEQQAKGKIGYRGIGPESVGGEFAASAEAHIAPRDNDWDEELPDEVLQAAQQANYITSREP